LFSFDPAEKRGTFRTQENKSQHALRAKKMLFTSVFLLPLPRFSLSSRCKIFSGVPAPLNSADYLTGVTRKENIISLCGLCVSSEAPHISAGQAGGEKLSLTYPHSKAGTIPLQARRFKGLIILRREVSETCLVSQGKMVVEK